MNGTTMLVRLCGLVAVLGTLLPANAAGPYTEVVGGVEWTYYTAKRSTTEDEYYAYNAYIANKDSIPEEVVIPQSLGGVITESIATRAFSGCTNLVSLTIPIGFRGFGFEAFAGCCNLSEVHIDSLEHWCSLGFANWEYGRQCSYGSNPLCTGAGLYTNGVLITDFVLPSNVVKIANGAFCNYQKLRSVKLHDGITAITTGAFYGCTNLENVDIGNGVKEIYTSAYYDLPPFGKCTSLTNLVLSSRLRTIQYSAFSGCTKLGSVTLPDSLQNLGGDVWGEAFNGCSSLTNVVFGTGLRKVGFQAFANCGLTHVHLPSNIVEISPLAFDGCRNLSKIKISGELTKVGKNAFRNCGNISEVHIDGLDSWCKIAFAEGPQSNPLVFGPELYVGGVPLNGQLDIPNGVENVAPYVFYGWTKVSSVSFPDSVMAIGKEAFCGCGARSVRFGDSLADMGYGIFENCENLANVDFGRMTADIGEGAFANCPLLSNVTIPGTVGKIRNDAFMSSGMTNLTICDGVKDVGCAFSMCEELSRVIIPNSVTNLAEYAFAYCNGLLEVNIGNGLARIPDGAFSECLNLTNILIGAPIKEIGNFAFMNCRKLRVVEIPASVVGIGYEAYAYCDSLGQITVGRSVANIGDLAFEGCGSLTNIVFMGDAPTTGYSPFLGADPSAVASVSRDSVGWGVAIGETWNGLLLQYWPDSLPDIASDDQIAEVLRGFADYNLAENISNKTEYDEFRKWASDNNLYLPSVETSSHAWASYLIGAETLLKNEPKIAIGEVNVVGGEGNGEAESAVIVLSVAVLDGDNSVKVAEENIAAMFEATRNVNDWDSESEKLVPNVEIIESDGETMRFKVAAGNGNAGPIFLRIRR